MVVRMNAFFFFVTKVYITLVLHSVLGECLQPNLGRSMLPNGYIFASGRSCTFLASCFLYAFQPVMLYVRRRQKSLLFAEVFFFVLLCFNLSSFRHPYCIRRQQSAYGLISGVLCYQTEIFLPLVVRVPFQRLALILYALSYCST